MASPELVAASYLEAEREGGCEVIACEAVLGPEELLRTLDRERLDVVDRARFVALLETV